MKRKTDKAAIFNSSLVGVFPNKFDMMTQGQSKTSALLETL